ncbi:MAG: phage head closure protein [Actinoallomurus sp.]|jgi:SPP1 family predicted phage head-tail adaptor
MKAGQLRRRIRLERPQTVADDFGAPVKSWALVAEVAAAIDSISGREFFSADRELADATWRLTVRALPGVTPEPDWRATDIDSGQIFDVRAVLPSHVRDVLTIAAASGSTEP